MRGKKQRIILILLLFTFLVNASLAQAEPQSSEKPRLLLVSYQTVPSPILPGTAFTLNLTLRNYGEIEARNITISLNLGGAATVLESGNAKFISTLASGAEKTLSFQMYSEGSTTSQSINIEANLAYEDSSGNSYTGNQAIGLLFTKRADPPPQPVVPEKKEPPKPQLIVSAYETDPSSVAPGERFTLSLTVRNNTSQNAAKNILISLANPSLAASGSGDQGQQQQGGQGTSSGIVVMRGSSNSRFLSYLAPGSEKEVNFDLIASPRASAGAYEVNVTLEYLGNTGKSFSSSQAIGLSLLRSASFEFQNLEYPREVVAGEEFVVSVDILNSSSFTVNGVILQFQGKGLTVREGTSFIGPLESGDSESLEAKVRAKSPGIKEGRLIIKYRDDFNQEQQLKKDFEIRALPRPALSEAEMPQRNKGGFFQGLVAFFKALLGLGS